MIVLVLKLIIKHLQWFPYNISHKKIDNNAFNTREAKKYYLENIYHYYEEKMKNSKTKSAKKMSEIFDEVKKIFIKSSI